MNENRPTIVVCGATGKQGGAVLDSLLTQDRWHLVALSRNPHGDAARRIRDRGVTVAAADLDDVGALKEAFHGAHGVYGVTTPMGPNGKLDIPAEWRQGVAIADAAAANDVRHLVLSTVLHVEEDVPVPYVRTKRKIERYVIDQGIPHTFLCPASFMDELGGEFLPLRRGVLTGQADGDAEIPYVACADIGAFAAMAFADPDRFLGQSLNLIGEFISGDALAALLTRVGGRDVRHKAPPVWLMRIFAREWIPLRRTFERWGRPPHPTAMLEALETCHRMRPQTLTFEGYLHTTGWQPPRD